MPSSFFYLQADKTLANRDFIDQLENAAAATKDQTYVISKPLGDSRYSYNCEGTLVVLSPKRKLTFVDFSGDNEMFEEFIDDFLEDLASISDKYRYKEAIGRRRKWQDDLVLKIDADDDSQFETWELQSKIADPARQRVAELLVSLLTGSINDIEQVKADLPASLLERVKRKILLFDGDQTRFIYGRPDHSPVRIQGLSGTGKTELLLHKLRDLYVNVPESKIIFTCHNKILADNLGKRIPDFFNFMKVEEQIAWNERLWCIHAWGSAHLPHSGTYRLICEIYQLPFHRYSPVMTFDKACSEALSTLRARSEVLPHFDFILIDESQDFPEPFIELCGMVARKTVYVAGDIFQSIFDEQITPTIDPDHLLSKCYRTDPRTLMFAHAIGMGLFEKNKLRWLEDREWLACGYLFETRAEGSMYRLNREPLRRFEDIDNTLPSVILDEVEGPFWVNIGDRILSAIKELAAAHPTLEADDVGIILLDSGNSTYGLADHLAISIPRELGWKVNKAHETKRRIKGELFISNRNNVKGLEFPFVICVSQSITNGYMYRNALYMTLTRSFIQSRLMVSSAQTPGLLDAIKTGLTRINEEGCIEVAAPTDAEKEKIKTTINTSNASLSLFDAAESVFKELNVPPILKESLLDAVRALTSEDAVDIENIREIIKVNHAFLLRSRG